MTRSDDGGLLIARWCHEAATMLGPTTTSWEIREGALVYASDDLFEEDGGECVRWDSIGEGATASMAGLGGRGAPDLPGWTPSRLEWLTLSRVGDHRPFMRRLPVGPDRDALVAAVRGRLGARWIGDDLPLLEAQRRLGIASSEWSKPKVAGLVVGVLVGLLALLLLLVLLLSPVVSIPVCTVVGVWLVREGLRGHRHAVEAAGVPVIAAAAARRGLVHLDGRVVAAHATPAAVTGRLAVWWDVAVFLEYREQESTAWRQVAARHGGTIDVVELQDDSGRLPVWLDGAELLLEQRTWHSRSDALPERGVALLDELGFPWHGPQTIRVTEQCLEDGGPVYVIGTLDERGRLPTIVRRTPVERVTVSVRTGTWRRALVAAVPHPLRAVVAVMIGYLDLMVRIGHARERPFVPADTPPPSIAAERMMVWKGSEGRPFVVSDRPEANALAAFKQRSVVVGAIGAALLCFASYGLFEVATGR